MGFTSNTNMLTLEDQLKRFKGNGKFDYDLVKLYVKNNPILMDMPVVESNDGTVYTATVAIGEHDPAWRAYGEGIPAAKINYKQMQFTAGRLVSGVQLEGDSWDEANEEGKAQVLQTELEAAAEGMKQEVAKTLFYGNAEDPRSFAGMAPYYNECGAHLPGVSKDEKGYYVINGAKETSPSAEAYRTIWCIAWDKSKFTAFYPKGHSSVGMERGALEPFIEKNDVGDTFKFYRQKLVWKLGFAPVDFRYAGAIRNIESDQMVTADGHVREGQPNYIQLIQKLTSRVNPSGTGKKVLYMARNVWENLMTIFGNMTQGNAIKFEDVDQYRNVPHLYGTPVVICDCLDVAEEAVKVANG